MIDTDSDAFKLIEELQNGPFGVAERVEIVEKYFERIKELPTPVNIVPKMNALVDIDDLLVGTYTILGEARAEPYEGQLAVAYVIVNRWKRPQYFKQFTIRGVCHANLQFSMWNNSPDRNLEITMRLPTMSKQFLLGLTAMLTAVNGTVPDPTKGADHYHTEDKPGYAKHWPPSWANNSKKTAKINAHVFYKLADK